MKNDSISKLWEAIGKYSVQVSSSGELAPPSYLHDAINTIKRELQAATLDIAENDAVIDKLRDQLKAANERAEQCDRDLDQALQERDHAQDALQKTHIALGGDGEWCAKLPPEEPSHSGDLHYDVPALAEQLRAQLAAQQGDAERWRAFVDCARIRFFGWAGYDNPNPYGNDPGDYRHFGAEFWTIHDAPTADKEQARKILEGFADAALRAKGGEE